MGITTTRPTPPHKHWTGGRFLFEPGIVTYSGRQAEKRKAELQQMEPDAPPRLPRVANSDFSAINPVTKQSPALSLPADTGSTPQKKDLMLAAPESAMTRRRFLASTTLAAGAACFAPHELLGAAQSLVEATRSRAADSIITVQKLRSNVSVLMGAGGNIGVLTGRDGKLLIDAGYAGARSRIINALATISSDPIKHLVTRTGTLITRTVMSGWTSSGCGACRVVLRMFKGAKELFYPGLPHGLTATHADQVNADLLKFLRSVQQARKAVA